jgi:hypothetical protein
MKFSIEYWRERKLKPLLTRVLGIQFRYRSETSKVRHLLLPFCIGNGCDVGFGGDKISKHNCLGIDYAIPYANTGRDAVDIACDVIAQDIPVADSSFDYVYTSHLIEDFPVTKDALKKFTRLLKLQGNLILVFPNQKKYEAHCSAKGLPMNPHHIHEDMGLEFMRNELKTLESVSYEEIYINDCSIDYNVIMVLKLTNK